MDSKFWNATLSTQVLADMQNPYGAYLQKNKWVGSPLLLHRRCENPMFQISNAICYNNKMFYCTKNEEKDNYLIEKSNWLDIKGSEIDNKNHYVKEEGQVVLNMISEYLFTYGILPHVYIITPFRTIAEEMRKELKNFFLKNSLFQLEEIDSWVRTSCGTIHTFQGKETDEVILLLGCSKQSLGAIKWVCQKPNILNVAVSRARKRLLIIGNENLWKEQPYFKEAWNILKERR